MDNSILVGAIIGGSIGLIMSGIGYLMALRSTGQQYLQTMPRRVLMFETPQSPDEVVARLSQGFPGSPIQLTASVPGGNRLLFAKNPGFTDWGFFYPVFVAAAPNGGSQVQVGIASRAFQWGPLVTKAHKNFVGLVQQTLGVSRTV